MNSLLKWALDHTSRLKLSVTEIKGLEKWELFDYCVELGWKGYRCKGRGSDYVAEMALVKAIAEALESSTIKYHDLPNSNGVAVHSNLSEAQRLSSFELYERDLWMCHYLTRTPFYKEYFSHPLINEFSKEKIPISIYRTKANALGSTFVAIAKGESCKKPFGLIVGLGFANEKSGAKKALTECARSLLHFWNSKDRINVLDFSNFSKLPNYTPETQGEWALSQESISGVFPWIEAPASDLSVTCNHKSSNNFKILNDPKKESDPPIYIVRCTNQKLQGLYFGLTKPEVLNFERLNDFSGKSYKFSDLNSIPHPLA